jgi:alpha-beta hydrolase superfamily lysophospholipase
VVVALHGFNDYAQQFDRPAQFWADRGILTYAYDQRGFGDAPQRGVWPGEDVLVQDLRELATLLRARHPGLPLYLLGTSMGGAVVMVAATGPAPPPYDGLILVAPAVWGRATMPAVQSVGLDVLAHVIPSFPVHGRGLDLRPTDNTDVLIEMSRNPKVQKVARWDTLYGVVNLMDSALAATDQLPGPALVLFGDNDEIIPEKPVHGFLQRLPRDTADPPRVALYESGFHMLLRDLQAKTVWTDIAAWIADRNAALPSGADLRAAAVMAREPAPPADEATAPSG